MTFGPLDGLGGGGPRSVERASSDHLATPQELLNDELLHEAGLAPRTRVPGWVWVLGAIAVVLVLAVLIGS